jgi:hypothetical protein
MAKNDIEDHIKEIRAALAREDARSNKPTNTSPSPSDILIAAREMMKRVKGKHK